MTLGKSIDKLGVAGFSGVAVPVIVIVGFNIVGKNTIEIVLEGNPETLIRFNEELILDAIEFAVIQLNKNGVAVTPVSVEAKYKGKKGFELFTLS